MPAVATSPAPITGDNYTRASAIEAISEHTGGGNRPTVQARAGKAWDAAVKRFNRYLWKFNRRSVDLTLSSVDATAGTISLIDAGEPGHIAEVERCILIDSSSKERGSVPYVPFEELMTFDANTVGTGPVPRVYSIRNAFYDGLVHFRPIISGALYPTARLHYFIGIALATDNDDRLLVPVDVDQAILEEATAEFMMRTDVRQAGPFKSQALDTRLDVEQRWRAYPDTYNMRTLGR